MKNSQVHTVRSMQRSDELDDLIKDALIGTSLRHSPPYAAEDQRTWASVLQRAQTEVVQLPASDMPCVSGAAAASIALSPALNTVPIERLTVNVPGTGVPYNFSAQVAHYRSLVEMKMWCSIGMLKLLGNSL